MGVARCGRRRKTNAKNSISGSAGRHKSSCKVDKFDLSDVEWTHKIPECPLYHPSEQEFRDPFLYLQKIAPHASKFGMLLKIDLVMYQYHFLLKRG